MFNPLKCKGKLVLHPLFFPKPSQNAPLLGFLTPTQLTVTLPGHSLPFWELFSHLNYEVTGPGQVILKSLQFRNIRLLGPGSKSPKVMSPQHQVGIIVSPHDCDILATPRGGLVSEDRRERHQPDPPSFHLRYH